MASPREVLRRFGAKLSRDRFERRRRNKSGSGESTGGVLEPLPNASSHVESDSRASPVQGSPHSSGSALVKGPTPEWTRTDSYSGPYTDDHGLPLVTPPATASTGDLTTESLRRKASASRAEGSSATASGTASTSKVAGKAPDRMPHASFSTGSTLLGSDSEMDRVLCYICGHRMGKKKSFDRIVEQLVYTPCGHSLWPCVSLQLALGPGHVQEVPNCAVTMRHMCEHIAIPMKHPPATAFTDKAAAVMPWNYEYCQTPRGVKLHESIDRAVGRLQKSETRKRNRNTAGFHFGHEAMRRIKERLVREAERKLDNYQKYWWSAKRIQFGLPPSVYVMPIERLFWV